MLRIHLLFLLGTLTIKNNTMCKFIVNSHFLFDKSTGSIIKFECKN